MTPLIKTKLFKQFSPQVLIALLFFQLNPQFASAFVQLSSSNCIGSQIHSLERPISSVRKNSPSRETFNYKFHLNRDVYDPAAPTVFFFAGGPGQTSFDKALSYPTEYQVVRLDPRGLGCNQDTRLKFFSTEDHARDILEVVRRLKPKNYFFHGISYGTMVSVRTAYFLEKTTNLTRPRALVLEGILGRSFLPGEYSANYILEWQRTFSSLPSSLQNLLSQKNLPLDLDDKTWGVFLSTHLLFGRDENGKSPLLEPLLNLESNNNEDQKWLKNFILQFSRPASLPQRVQHQQITCREIAPDMNEHQFDFELIEGDLRLRDVPAYCQNTNDLALYDSSLFQVQIPVIAFHGEYDVATPRFQTEYFLNHQKLTQNKIFFPVPRGGHAALSGNLATCNENFWSSLNQRVDQQSLSLSLAPCLTNRE